MQTKPNFNEPEHQLIVRNKDWQNELKCKPGDLPLWELKPGLLKLGEVDEEAVEKDWSKKDLNDPDILSTHDILRDRIKDIEQRFLVLKRSFKRYFSTAV